MQHAVCPAVVTVLLLLLLCYHGSETIVTVAVGRRLPRQE
jgi:hypothetical protein